MAPDQRVAAPESSEAGFDETDWRIRYNTRFVPRDPAPYPAVTDPILTDTCGSV